MICLDGDDRLIDNAQRQGQARKHPSAVDHNGASSALAVVAALLGAGESDVLTKRVEQSGPRIDLE
jgi:hypothetical protein